MNFYSPTFLYFEKKFTVLNNFYAILSKCQKVPLWVPDDVCRGIVEIDPFLRYRILPQNKYFL